MYRRSYENEWKGCGDITTEDSGLDVYSPAAYLADLLWIVETYISSSFDIPGGYKLSERRQDLYTLELTKENTETLIPYTDIITKRLTDILAKKDAEAFGGEDSDTCDKNTIMIFTK